MNILLLYATYSGGTQAASQIVEEQLRAKSHTVTVKQAMETNPDELSQYDLVILGSPSWDIQGKTGQPHEDFGKLIAQSQGKSFEGKKFAIFGLGDSSYMHFCGAVDHLEEFLKTAKATLATTSLRIDGFYYNLPEHTTSLQTWTADLLTKVS